MKKIQIKCQGALALPYSEIEPLQGNLKDLSQENYEKLKKEILELGFSEPISIWRHQGKNYTLNGHQRLRTIKQMVETEGFECPPLPVSVIEADSLKEAKKKILALTSQYGQITGQGLYEFSVDAGLSPAEIEESFRFPEIKIDDWKLEFFEESGDGLTDPDEVPEPPAVPKTKRGDIYQLGRHRLMCGDSTGFGEVESLMVGEKADLCFTSPPYNLGISSKLSGNSEIAKNANAYAMHDDKMGQPEYADFLYDFAQNALSVSRYLFTNIQTLAGNRLSLWDWTYRMREQYCDTLVWDKQHAPPQQAERVVNSRFEFIFIHTSEPNPNRAVRISPNFRGTIDNVYVGPPQRANDFSGIHGATFPVHLPEYYISTFTENGASVLDLFGGCGTTLIACEKTNRRCFMMEIDPLYCSVIIERWEKFTGQKAELITQSSDKAATGSDG